MTEKASLQKVVIMTRDNDIFGDAPREVTLMHTVTSEDLAFDGRPSNMVTLTINDNDEAGIMISRRQGGGAATRRAGAEGRWQAHDIHCEVAFAAGARM